MIVENRIEDIYEKCYSTFNIEDIDFSGITLIYYNIIAGCILAMAMKYAGSGDIKAKNLIIEEIKKLRKLKTIKTDFSSDRATKNKLELYNLFHLFSVHCLSLSIIMAGTLDADCLKIIRVIRKKLQFQFYSHYGFNMAIHMAIGFLGLGSGGYTFGRSEMDIASLLMSVYPHFPLEINDNQYHLQALRHLYVLAVKPK
jgi:anaphase-promoting complex subunit 1